MVPEPARVLLPRAVRRPRWAYAAIGVALVIGVTMFPFLERSANVRLRGSRPVIGGGRPGTSLPAMNALTADVVDELGRARRCRAGGRPRRPGGPLRPGRERQQREIWLTLDDSTDHDASVASIEQVLATYPDLSHRVTTYTEQRITDVLEGRDRDVVVRVYGANMATLEAKADEVREAFSGIEGLERPLVEVSPHRADGRGSRLTCMRAQQFGVKPGDVRRASAILLSGLAVGNLFEEQKVFDVVVWGTPDIRRSVEDVEQLLNDTPTGERVRLHEVADVSVVENPDRDPSRGRVQLHRRQCRHRGR